MTTQHLNELITYLEGQEVTGRWNFEYLVAPGGGSGCALGQFPYVWPKTWKFISFGEDGYSISKHGEELEQYYKRVQNGVEEWLGINCSQFLSIFMFPSNYGCDYKDVTPLMVAAKLRSLAI